MDVRELLKELPLAEAALALLGHVAGVKELSELYDQHRGRSYQKKLSFPDLFQVVVEALVQHQGRGRQAFERSVERDEISCSIQAVFGKLRRVPLPLSQAVLSDCTDRVRALYPAEQVTSPVPASLQAFHIVIIDAKTLKRVARRLKCLQGLKVGVLGGKVLAVLDGTTGLVLAFTAHPDGDSSDLPLLPDALPLARQRLPGTRLFIADRNFCDLLQMARFTEEGDHFVLRHHQKVLFYSDTMAPTLVPSAIRQDRFGRAYTDEWGWTGSPKRSDRCYVRRILLERPGEKPIALLTDLIDAHAYPATDILEIYLQRWGIERVFQQLSDVFGLLQLMGCTPLASIFQASLCMLLYNVLQVLRAHVAVTHQRQPRTLSPEQQFPVRVLRHVLFAPQ